MRSPWSTADSISSISRSSSSRSYCAWMLTSYRPSRISRFISSMLIRFSIQLYTAVSHRLVNPVRFVEFPTPQSGYAYEVHGSDCVLGLYQLYSRKISYGRLREENR